MHKCCNSAPNDIVAANKTDKACKVKSPNLKIFNTYSLNKFQSDKLDNSLLFDVKLKRTFGKEAVKQKDKIT
jgi:hypothetical protein